MKMAYKKLTTIFSFIGLGALISAGFVFLTQIMIARQLSIFEFGIFSSSLVTITLLVPLAGFGVAGFWLRLFAKEGWHGMHWLPSSFYLILFSSTIVFVLLLIWSFYGPHGPLTASILPIMGLYIYGQVISELVISKLQLEERYRTLMFWQFVPPMSRFIIILILLYAISLSINLKDIAYVYALTSLFVLIFGLSSLSNMLNRNFLLKGHNGFKQVLSGVPSVKPNITQVAIKAWPYSMLGILYLVYFQSDIIMLKYLVGAEAAGIYNSSVLLLMMIYLLPGSIYQKYLLPKFHYWVNQDTKQVDRIYNIGNIVMLLLGTLFMLFLWNTAHLIIPALFGSKFHVAIQLTKILSLVIPIHFLVISTGTFLVTIRPQKKVLCMSLVAMLNVFLNFVLIPKFEFYGAAMATIISEFVLVVLYLYSSNTR